MIPIVPTVTTTIWAEGIEMKQIYFFHGNRRINHIDALILQHKNTPNFGIREIFAAVVI